MSCRRLARARLTSIGLLVARSLLSCLATPLSTAQPRRRLTPERGESNLALAPVGLLRVESRLANGRLQSGRVPEQPREGETTMSPHWHVSRRTFLRPPPALAPLP